MYKQASKLILPIKKKKKNALNLAVPYFTSMKTVLFYILVRFYYCFNLVSGLKYDH